MNRAVSRRVIARVMAGKLLQEPAKRNHWLNVLAAFMVENKLEADAGMLVNDIAHEIFVQSGELLVTVTSARPLTESIRSDLSVYLQQQTDARSVVITERTDPQLIGGLIARTPDQELDTTIRSQLQQLAAIH